MMDYQKEAMNEIREINRLFDWFCEKIKNEHHKQKDGIWQIAFDRWCDDVTIYHNGYWLDSISVTIKEKDLIKGLNDFKEKVKKRMDEEIEKYDFVNHCGNGPCQKCGLPPEMCVCDVLEQEAKKEKKRQTKAIHVRQKTNE